MVIMRWTRSTVQPHGAALALTVAVSLSACSGSASSPHASAVGRLTPTVGEGPKVSAGSAFGREPTIVVPATVPPPTEVSAQVLTQGAGSTVASGQVVVADVFGQTWDLKDGRPNVFDDSFARGLPIAFPVGIGRVIQGLDQTLVGKQVGSRLLVTIPANQGFGATANPKKPLSGHALVFLVDLRGALELHSAAAGTAAGPLPAGLPVVTSTSGTKPAIRSSRGQARSHTPVRAASAWIRRPDRPGPGPGHAGHCYRREDRKDNQGHLGQPPRHRSRSKGVGVSQGTHRTEHP